ncbi:MAG: hypothetical protein Sapg2KO_17350 [Saprospiraceae bacterium]
MEKKKRNWVGVIVLVFLLGVFPILSYVYMKAGFDYQLDARAELKKLGTVMSLPDTTIFGDTLVGTKMGKQISLLSYFDPTDQQTLAISGKYLSEIHNQFNDVDWFRMDLLVPQTAKSALSAYQEEYEVEDAEQVFFYQTNQSLQEINGSLYVADSLQNKFNCVALADTTGTIVNYYDLSDGKQFVRLVEHIAIMRPKEKAKPQAIFQREREL